MENKTKEQLAEEYANECDDCYSNDFWGFIKGYDSRQPEIDALKEQIPKLTNELKLKLYKEFGKQSFRGYPNEQCDLIWNFFLTHLNKQNHE